MLEAALLETLNSGDKEALLALHGIGKKRAEMILEASLCFYTYVSIYHLIFFFLDGKGPANTKAQQTRHQARETQGPRPFTSLQDLADRKILPPKALETLAMLNLRG